MTTKNEEAGLNRPLTAFGELAVAEPIPVVQIDAIFGMRDKTDVETFSSGSGTATTATLGGTGKVFKCSTGTDVGGYGVVRSNRVVRYRPGQGTVFRYTALFDEGVTLSGMRAGAFTTGNELSFGYNGSSFGILHRTAGRLEIQRLTIGTGAGGNETATILLNGTTFTVSLTSGNPTHTAFEIGAASLAGYGLYQNNSTVVINSKAVGPETGEFSFTTTGAAVGTFASITGGQAVVDTWYTQSAWNGHALNNTRQEDPFVLDPQKGNVYQIKMQYLGYGAINFEIEDPSSGQMITVHRLKYSNANTGPSVEMPIFKLGWFAFNAGDTTDKNCYGASAAGITEGIMHQMRNPEGKSATRTSIGTDFTNVLSIRNRSEFQGVINLQEMLPYIVTGAVDGTKPAEIAVYLNPVIGGETDWQYVDQTHSTVEFSTAGDTVTSGTLTQELTAAGIAKAGDIFLNLKDYDVHMQRGDVLTVAVKATSGTTDATVGVTWLEE